MENFSLSDIANKGTPIPSGKTLLNLSGRFRYMQVHSTAATLDFVMQLVDIIRHAQNQKLGFHFDLTAQKELPEIHILFQYTKRAFYLYGAVDPKQDPFPRRDPRFGIGPLPQKCL